MNQSAEKRSTSRGSKQDSAGKLFRDFRIDTLEKTAVAGLGKKYLARQC
jgi:hypothetical protein